MAIKAVSKKVDIDIREENVAEDDIGPLIAEALSVKGFCVLAPDVEIGRLESATKDIEEIDKQGRLSQPPEMILEGLLGLAGSARIAEVEMPEDPEKADRFDGKGLWYFDNIMTEMSVAVAPYLPNMQIEVKARTCGILHEAGMPTSAHPELDEDTCAKWVTVFAQHKIMCVWALGPGAGTLELQPFDGDSNDYAVPMKPGTLVLLRTDAMSHRFTAVGKAYCLTCWLLKAAKASKHKDNTAVETTPCCQALEEWAEAKIREYKEAFAEEQAHLSLPRYWEAVMNHTQFVNQHVAVRTASIKQNSSYEPWAWASAFYTGVDYCYEIPNMRFALDWHYDAHPEGWNWNKINVRHGAFIDGVELFDNSIFRISRAEAAGMDPGHRMTLETGYEALIRDGYKIATIMNTRGGVYVANPPPAEWGMAEKDCTSSGVCGGGGSIACGRFSFVHGLKGPCISVDVESASSLVAINFCSTNLSRTGKWEPIPYGLVQSWNLMLHPMFMVHACAAGRLCPQGRTFSLDASANGYVRGECATSLLLKAMSSVVDGQVVVNEGFYFGTLAAAAVNQNGRRAHITAPDATALQECMMEAVKQAEISPLDVDAVEIASDAVILLDAIEVASTTKALRPEGMPSLEMACPLNMLCSKTNVANQLEAIGCTTILRVLLSMQWGVDYPQVHLRLLNPHMDLEVCDRRAFISSEALEYPMASAYHGVTNRSLAGTNCHCLCFGQINDGKSKLIPGASFQREKIFFWPEGGGALEDDMVPKRGYQLISSANGWQPENMDSEGGGIYSAILTIGENRWERFQILLDGDRRRVLYPSYDRLDQATKGAPVAGPEDVFHSDSWLIDTRPDFTEEAAIVPAGAAEEISSQDKGKPGDRFQIRLVVKGKWRIVEWENLDKDKTEVSPVAAGTYSLSGSWSQGELQAMTPDPSTPGLHSAEVTLTSLGVSTFQVIRNADWDQAFYPDVEGAHSSAPGFGPDLQVGTSWGIEGGRPGDVYKINFERGAAGDIDSAKVTWTFIREVELNKVQSELSRVPPMFVVGTWDGMMTPSRMHWTGEYFQFYVQLGSSLRASFQVFVNGLVSNCLYPSVQDANPFEKHDLKGPDRLSAGLAWTIGANAGDDPAPGKRYEIRLRVNEEDYSPLKLDWMPVRGIEGLEDAKGRGFLVLSM